MRDITKAYEVLAKSVGKLVVPGGLQHLYGITFAVMRHDRKDIQKYIIACVRHQRDATTLYTNDTKPSVTDGIKGTSFIFPFF